MKSCLNKMTIYRMSFEAYFLTGLFVFLLSVNICADAAHLTCEGNKRWINGICHRCPEDFFVFDPTFGPRECRKCPKGFFNPNGLNTWCTFSASYKDVSQSRSTLRPPSSNQPSSIPTTTSATYTSPTSMLFSKTSTLASTTPIHQVTAMYTTSASLSNNPGIKTNKTDEPNSGLIIGLVVGFITSFIIIVCVCCYFKRKRQARKVEVKNKPSKSHTDLKQQNVAIFENETYPLYKNGA